MCGSMAKEDEDASDGEAGGIGEEIVCTKYPYFLLFPHMLVFF